MLCELEPSAGETAISSTPREFGTGAAPSKTQKQRIAKERRFVLIVFARDPLECSVAHVVPTVPCRDGGRYPKLSCRRGRSHPAECTAGRLA